MASDFVDFTILAKKGLLKTEPATVHSSREVIDFTQPTQVQQESQTTQTTGQSPFDFLNSFAQTAAQTQPQTQPSSSMLGLEPKIDTILSKLEDTMYKLETLSSRIVQLESKLGLSGLR